MAVLSDPDRVAVWAQWMQENGSTIAGSMTKAEFRAAVNAADTWANDNAAAFNSALPLPARTVLSSAQKALLLNLVVLKRYVAGA